jgi:hypothetical protein
LAGQSYLLSSIEIFWICGWMSLAVIALIWLARRPGGQTAGAAVGDLTRPIVRQAGARAIGSCEEQPHFVARTQIEFFQ